MDDDFINYIPFRQGEFGPYQPRARPVDVPAPVVVKVEERGEEERGYVRRAVMGVVPKWPEDPDDDMPLLRMRRAWNESPERPPKGEPIEDSDRGLPSRENTPPRRDNTIYVKPLFALAPGPPPASPSRRERNDATQPPPLFSLPPSRYGPPTSLLSLPPLRSPSRREMRDGPPRRTRSRSPLPPRFSSSRAPSVASYAQSRAQSAARSPRRRRRNDDDSASIIHGARVRGEVQVMNNPVFPKREKKEDPDGDDEVRIVGGTSRRSMSRRARSRHSRSLSRNPFDGYIANIRKRPGDDDDPVCFCPDRNASAAPRDEPVTITVLSAIEKAPFRMVMLDPTYGLYPLEAVRVERPEEDTREVKRYFFEFQPKMYGPHIALLTMDDFFLVHSVRVHGTGPPPQRRRGEGGRPPLISMDVHGVPEDMRTLFHAARPRRDDEKFVDPRRVLEQLLG